MTVVESRPEGWLYAAPIDLQRAVVWWITDPQQTIAEDTSKKGRVLHQAENSFLIADWLKRERLSPEGVFLSRDASFSGLDKTVGNGWVAVGDAAISLDPLSSSGISAAMLAGLHAGTALAAWAQGDNNALKFYERILVQVCNNHSDQRKRFYALEKRWLNTTFWLNRS
jgi:flavin-dependent dehydrogenase